ncbi:MAG: TIGR00341 family protein [Paludibacteraceae bacterium]|nr:TIGR00341 family protein [Paludibacteraceae bacterium]
MQADERRRRILERLRKRLSLTDYIDVAAADTNIRSNIGFRGPNVYILFVAIIIASVGLNVNSIPVIIGAMLISPLMSPIIGFGLGLGTNDTKLLLESLKNLGIMFVISLVASTLYFLLTPLDSDNPTELLARTNPSVYDVLVAFFGGIAGILELSRKEKGTVLSGVAIATALMPPLCTVGYGIANWNWQYAGGALYLFFINCVFIALATYLAVKYLGFPVVKGDGHRSRRLVITYGLLIVGIIVPSCFSAYNIARENSFSKEARYLVRDMRSLGGTYIYDYSTDTNQKTYTLTLRLAGESLSSDWRAKLYTEADKHGISAAQIIVQEDATIEVRRLNETEVMRDWLASTEEQLRVRDDSIRSLQSQVDTYAARELPSAQLAAELRSQWPSVHAVTLARGNTVQADEETEETVVVVLRGDGQLTADELQRMENWLAIRLQTPTVQVIWTQE